MNALQLYSFILDENTVDNVELYVFKLPEEVKKRIEQIRDNYQKMYKSVAAKAMFKVAASIFDTVIYSNNSLSDIWKDDNIWFYSLEEFDLKLLKVKVKEWIRREQENIGLDVDVDFREEWSFDQKITLKEVLKSKNSKFNIIPSYYAYKLSKEEFCFDSLQRSLKFNRVIDDNKATIMTMPVRIEKKLYTPFSYAIEITLKDVIDSDKLTLHFYLKIKRWEFFNKIEDENLKISSKENISVYVYKENEFYNYGNVIFNKISIKKHHKENQIIYNNTADRIYCEMMNVNIINALGKIEEPYDESEIYLVGYKVRDIGKLKITQVGAGLPERNEMISLINKKLDKLFLRESINSLKESKFSKIEKIYKDNLSEYRLDRFITTGSGEKGLSKETYVSYDNIKKINMMLVTSNKELVEMIIASMRYYLRLNEKLNDMLYRNETGLEVEFNIIEDSMTRAIEDDETFEDRRIKVESFISNIIDITALNLAIIDIERFDKDKEYKNKDPKKVLRVALKNKKVLSQFISFNEKATIDVVLNTVRDIISAASFQEAFLYSDKGVSESDILLGINMISTSNNEKRIGISKIENGVTYIKLYPDKNWVEIKDYIYLISKKVLRNTKIKIDKFTKPQIEQWIEDVIVDEMSLGKMVYCFVDCVLRNNGWSYITNNKFLRFDSLIIPGKERLRIIRINSTDEVPDYYIENNKGKINKNKGIFKSDKNTYYIIGSRIETDSGISMKWTKMDAPCKPLRRPSLYEVNIQGAITEEERDRIIVMTQNLRKMNITYNNESSAPLPLYCLGRLSEYLIAEESLN